MSNKSISGSSGYGIEKHAHIFAAWAASRAASVKGCRFDVRQGRNILEKCGFKPELSKPEHLPEASAIDSQHRIWREQACDFAKNHVKADTFELTHGVAAKLINVYLKSRFVCGGYHDHPRVMALHPPIDKELLKALARKNFGGHGEEWKNASNKGWSKMTSCDYEGLITLIRDNLQKKPLWMIEEYWKGHQCAT